MNREWLEYAQINTDPVKPLDTTLHIVTEEGIEHKVISTDMDLRGFAWVDNDYLLIESLREDQTSARAKATLWLLNPFTEERQELFNDYPNQWNGDRLEWEFSLSRVIYNRSINRVIYPIFVEPDRVMRLVNVKTNEIIANIPTTDYGKFPAWSSDGKRMAFATQTNKGAEWKSYQDEIFILTENGELAQLTHLSKANNYSYIIGLSWSADSNHIAFWVNNDDWEKGSLGAHLAILDTFTGKVREYCDLGTSDNIVYIPEWGNPIWSTDDMYLVVNLQDISNDPNIFDSDKHVFAVLVEVATGNAFQVAENYQAVGWLK